MQKNKLIRSFICVIFVINSSVFGASNVQKFIDLAQKYWDNKTHTKSYRNQNELKELVDLMPEAEQDLAQETRDNRKHLEVQAAIAKNLPNKNVYDARIALQKALCNAQDISPLKAALAQAKALLNPHVKELQRTAMKTSENAKTAAQELKTAEVFLDTQWKIFNDKKAETSN